MSGVVYGLGLGPGDPELMTLKAVRLIAGADVVVYPAPLGGESFARSIAADVIPKSAREIRIDIPMERDRFPAQDAYDRVAIDILAAANAGATVVVLCEGDPFFYGSFMYLFSRLSDKTSVEVVPGVTSVTACAAVLGRPLSARNETLSIIPGTLPEDELAQKVAAADAMAIMKVGRNLPKIRRVLAAADLEASAGYVERATLPAQVVHRLSDAPDDAPYFSMILASKGGDPWLN